MRLRTRLDQLEVKRAAAERLGHRELASQLRIQESVLRGKLRESYGPDGDHSCPSALLNVDDSLTRQSGVRILRDEPGWIVFSTDGRSILVDTPEKAEYAAERYEHPPFPSSLSPLQEASLAFEDLHPRDRHGRFISKPLNVFKDYRPWDDGIRKPSLFKPKPHPATRYQAWAQTPAAPVVLQADIKRRAKNLKSGSSTRLPEGVLVTKHKGKWRVDGPTGIHHVATTDAMARKAEREEQIARADRFANTIPGNPLGPLTGVDIAPIDPVGDQIGGMLHGSWVTLPRGTKVHRIAGDAGDQFEVVALDGKVEIFPAIDKDSTIKAAKAAEIRAGVDPPETGTRERPAPNPNSRGPLRPLPDGFVDSRKKMHEISATVLGVAQQPANEVALFATPGGFGTPEFTQRGVSTQLRTEGDRLIRETNGRITASEKIIGVEPDAADVMADFFKLTDEALRELSVQNVGDEPSPAILWPEHFDMGIMLGKPEYRANFGASPGDEAHPEPYFYVGPWDPPEPSKTWNGAGFNGAELTYAEVLAAPDQKKAIRDFFRSRLKALKYGAVAEALSCKDDLAEAGFRSSQLRGRSGEWSGHRSGQPKKKAQPAAGRAKIGKAKELLATPLRPPKVPDVEVVVGPDTLGGLGATEGNVITVSPVAPPSTVSHELGHVFDLRYMSDANRAEFQQIIGKGGTPWWTQGNDSPAEWFAEAYSRLSHMKQINPRWEYTAGEGLMTGKQLIATSRLIRRIADEHGLTYE